MKVTKYGHCCLLIELMGKRVLTDPGSFSEGFLELTDIDLILITHEHADHLHTESLQELLKQNPQATVVTNAGVGKLLNDHDIAYTELPDRTVATVANLSIKPYEGEHVEIVGGFGLVQNTGFLLGGGEFYYAGDSYTVPEEQVNLLAVPVAGPWCKVSEAIAYALAVNPKHALPVHDAVLSEVGMQGVYAHFQREFEVASITFIALGNREEYET